MFHKKVMCFVPIRRINVSRSNCLIFSFICHVWWMPDSQDVRFYPPAPSPYISMIRMRILSLWKMFCGCERLGCIHAFYEANFNSIFGVHFSGKLILTASLMKMGIRKIYQGELGNRLPGIQMAAWALQS